MRFRAWSQVREGPIPKDTENASTVKTLMSAVQINCEEVAVFFYNVCKKI